VDESENTTKKGFNHKHVGVASLSCRKIMTTPSSPSPSPLLPKDDVFSRSNGSGLVNTLDGVRRKIKSHPKKAKKRSLTEKDAQSNPWHPKNSTSKNGGAAKTKALYPATRGCERRNLIVDGNATGRE